MLAQSIAQQSSENSPTWGLMEEDKLFLASCRSEEVSDIGRNIRSLSHSKSEPQRSIAYFLLQPKTFPFASESSLGAFPSHGTPPHPTLSPPLKTTSWGWVESAILSIKLCYMNCCFTLAQYFKWLIVFLLCAEQTHWMPPNGFHWW